MSPPDPTDRGGAPDRWALVLGSSSGLGAAVGVTAARRLGLSLFGVHRGRWPDHAAEVAREVREAGRQVRWWIGDAGPAEAATAGVEALAAALGPEGRVQLLMHALASASVGELCVGDPFAPRQIESTFDRMAHSFVYWVRAVHARGLFAPGAQILALSNMMTEVVAPGTALIAASKGALEQYVRYLARELGPLGLRVNLLKFGLVVTPAVRATFPAERLARLERVMVEAAHARRLPDLQEVADLVIHLAGPEARWFNGATIDFSGGETHAFFDLLLRGDAP